MFLSALPAKNPRRVQSMDIVWILLFNICVFSFKTVRAEASLGAVETVVVGARGSCSAARLGLTWGVTTASVS